MSDAEKAALRAMLEKHGTANMLLALSDIQYAKDTRQSRLEGNTLYALARGGIFCEHCSAYNATSWLGVHP